MGFRGVMAIDFGTANTYFCKCPEDQVSPKGVDFNGENSGISTVILYREGKDPLIGPTAFEEFGDAPVEVRSGYRFAAQFKPDIATSIEARNNAIEFLKAVLDNARKKFIDIEPTERRVIFGVPAEADIAFRERLKEVALAAGYGSVETREEPIGGLFYHVADKTIAPRDALRGVLVVDFGGGTCDFTFTYRGAIKRSWGDMYLGGRILDDVFFQWLMEQNPNIERELSPQDKFFLLFSQCRELKERFSRRMKDDRSATFSRTVGDYGRLSEATWNSFVERCRCYRPSATFAQHLREMKANSLLTERNEAIDIIGWFQECMLKGFEDSGIDLRDIATVILTGGSSQWIFVADIIQATLGINSDRIRRSERPYAAISEGLAIEPALRSQLRATRQTLEQDLPRFKNEQVNRLVDDHIERTANEIADAICLDLFDIGIKPSLFQFRENGGKIADLKSEVAAHATAFEPRIKSIVSTASDSLAIGLPELVLEKVQVWFNENGLRIDRDMLEFTSDRVATPELDEFNLPDLLAGFKNLIVGVAGGIVGIVTASVCGGGGTALIMTGPAGWLIGLVIGAAVAYFSVSLGLEKARATAESFSLPGWMISRVLTNAKIDSARRTLHIQTREQVLVELNKLRSTLNERLEDVVRKEINAISELHHLS